MMNDGDSEFVTNNWILQFKSMEKLTEKLQFVLLILYSVESPVQKKFEREILKFEDYLNDVKFMRAVKHRDALVDEYSAEYFGKDYGGDDPFSYNFKLEMKINKISMDLLSTLGRLIKVVKESEFSVGADT